jgi:hypothetical protein
VAPAFERRRVLVAAFATVALPVSVLAVRQSPSVTLEHFGGGTGVSDNAPAIVAALEFLNARAGGVLRLGAGGYRVDSQTLKKLGGIELAPNIELAGAGKNATLLQVTGHSQCHFFVNEANSSNHFIRDLTVRGNGIATANGPGGFYYCSVLAGKARADVSNCRFENVRFENFGGDFWVRFYCTSPDRAIQACGFEAGCEAVSERGNAREPGNLGVTSYVIEFRGDGGLVSHCFVRGLKANLEWVKGGVAAFGNVRGLTISDVILEGAFTGYQVPDKGGYAILLYDTSASDVVTGTTIERPTITRPYSCGLYLAGTRDTTIVSPRISGQSDTVDGTLPKGAITLNGANRVAVRDPVLSDNAYDIQIAGISGPEYDDRMGIVISGGSGTNTHIAGIKIRSSPYAYQCGGIQIANYRSVTGRPGGSGMVWQLHPDFQGSGKPSGILGVVWENGECSGGPGGFDINLNVSSNVENPSGDLTLSGLKLNGNGVRGSLVAVGCTGGEIHLAKVEFAGRAYRHVDVRNCNSLILDDVDFTGISESGVHVFVTATPHNIQGAHSATSDRLIQSAA